MENVMVPKEELIERVAKALCRHAYPARTIEEAVAPGRELWQRMISEATIAVETMLAAATAVEQEPVAWGIEVDIQRGPKSGERVVADCWTSKSTAVEKRGSPPFISCNAKVVALYDHPSLPADKQAAQEGVYAPIFDEITKAVAKFPTWPTDPLHALAILGEEFGELTKAVLQLTYEPHKTDSDEVRTEAIQTAAMALRFFKSLNVYHFAQCDQHNQDAIRAEALKVSAGGR